MASQATGEIRFDGQVAVITGAGEGMGSEHAQLLAKRGAKIVINDLIADPAKATIEKIRAAGGTAIAVAGSIAERSVAEEIVKAAIDNFGRIDILINNAGIEIKQPFEKFNDAQLQKMLSIHLIGSWVLTQLCWPYMKQQKYGRIVMVCSTSIYGMPENSAYVAAKGGLLGLGKALAIEGKEHGIAVNCFGPSAFTAMARIMVPDKSQHEYMAANFPPAATSPICAWLAHKDCCLTGDFITAYGKKFGRVFIAETQGFTTTLDSLTIEAVRDHMEEARDETGYVVPKSIEDQSQLLFK